MKARTAHVLLTAALAALLAACGRGGESVQGGERAASGVVQTKFPGQVSAGGATSGAIMAQAKQEPPPAEPPAQAAQEGERGQGGAKGNVSGTPGIPEGAGGTPSGAAMGGTTPQAAASQAAPGAPPAAEKPAASKEEKEKLDLAAAMDRVAERWRERARQEGKKMPPPVTEQTSGASGDAPPLPIRSEKHGTAPPSEDVKNPAEKGL